MHRVPVLKLLLEPSALSGLAVVATAFGVIAFSGWSYIQNYGLFYDFLFGPQGVETVLLQEPDRFQMLRSMLRSPFAYYIFIGCAGVVTGLAVYTILQISSELRRSGQSFLRHGRPVDRSVHHELVVRFLIRLLGGTAWACFTVFFVQLLVPFAVSLTHTGLERLPDQIAWGIVALMTATVIIAVSLHAHVVFLRIFLLRYRAFGGAAIVTEEKMHTT